MSLNDTLRSTSFDLIDRFGKQVTYYRNNESGEPVYDPLTGLFQPASTQSNQTLKVSPPSSPKGSMLMTGQVVAEDLYFKIAALGLTFEPKVNDELDIDAQRWKVKKVAPVYSGEDIAYFDVWVCL